jgi:hypothetical protein
MEDDVSRRGKSKRRFEELSEGVKWFREGWENYYIRMNM